MPKNPPVPCQDMEPPDPPKPWTGDVHQTLTITYLIDADDSVFDKDAAINEAKTRWGRIHEDALQSLSDDDAQVDDTGDDWVADQEP